MSLWMRLGLISLLTAGCSSTGLTPATRSLERDVAELQERVLELQRKAAVSEVELARLRRQIAALEAEGAGGGAPGRPAASAAPAPTTAPAEVYTPPPPRIVELDQRDLEDEELPPEQPTRDASASVYDDDREAIPAAAQALYDRGYTLYHQGQYLDSESSFQRFLEAYPKSDLADNAQYWIGECRYARHDLRGALAAFRETVNRYPDGNKVPDALLKAGQVLEALGDLAGARESYREIQRRFPDSAAAIGASERLQGL